MVAEDGPAEQIVTIFMFGNISTITTTISWQCRTGGGGSHAIFVGVALKTYAVGGDGAMRQQSWRRQGTVTQPPPTTQCHPRDDSHFSPISGPTDENRGRAFALINRCAVDAAHIFPRYRSGEITVRLFNTTPVVHDRTQQVVSYESTLAPLEVATHSDRT
ncbi:hypothetical protein ACI65C_012304 [Semiaphis heraclei]